MEHRNEQVTERLNMEHRYEQVTEETGYGIWNMEYGMVAECHSDKGLLNVECRTWNRCQDIMESKRLKQWDK